MAFITAVAVALAFLQQGNSPVNDLPAKYRTTPPAGNTVVARVGGVDITAADVEPLLWEWRGQDAMQDLIAYQLVRAEAQKQRIDVAEKEIEDLLSKSIAD